MNSSLNPSALPSPSLECQDLTVTKTLINRHVKDQQTNARLKDELKQYFKDNPVKRTANARRLKLDQQQWYKLPRLIKHLDSFLLARQPNAANLGEVHFSSRTCTALKNRLFELIVEKDLLNKSLTLKEICVWFVTEYPQMMVG